MGERLWAPWRMEYIRAPKPDECIFCAAARADDDEPCHVLRRGEHCFALLNAYPYNNGHVMVSPYAHVASTEALDGPALHELMALANEALGAMRRALAPDGFNVGVNIGKVAGAGFDDHVHLHVVPRWAGDTNFMPVTGGTRVLSQALAESYAVLRDAWSR